MKNVGLAEVKELFLLSDASLDGVKVPLFGMTPNVLEKSSYSFRSDLLRVGLRWVKGATTSDRNMLLVGPTGTGKSSFAEQFGCRLGLPVYRIPCHAQMEPSDFWGRMTLKNGSTEWVDGPLTLAFRDGGIALIDEFDFVPPSIFGMLNSALDYSEVTLDNGERFLPHENARILLTANTAIADGESNGYVGTEAVNRAIYDRVTCGMRLTLSKEDRARRLAVEFPYLSSKMVTFLVTVGDLNEQALKDEVIAVPMTRAISSMARVFNQIFSMGETTVIPMEKVVKQFAYTTTFCANERDRGWFAHTIVQTLESQGLLAARFVGLEDWKTIPLLVSDDEAKQIEFVRKFNKTASQINPSSIEAEMAKLIENVTEAL